MRLALAAAVLFAVACLAAAAGPASTAESFVTYYDPAWSPDGTQIVFTSRGDSDGDLFVMNADGTGVRQITHSNYKAGNWAARLPDWSPDGRWIVFGYRFDGIDLIRPDGTGQRTIAHGTNPAWSPRGLKIAFSCCIDEGDVASVYTVGLAGGRPTLVAKADHELRYLAPTWSPDGQRLAFGFAADPEGDPAPHAIGVISKARGPVKLLRTGGFHPIAPDWSPAGGKIVFTDDFDSICVLDLNTYRVRRIVGTRHPDGGFLYRPQFSPDGKRIVFTWAGGIWVADADGTHRRELLAPDVT